MLSPLSIEGYTAFMFPKSVHVQLSKSLPFALKHLPFSTVTLLNVDTPLTFDSSENNVLLLFDSI